MTIELPKSTLTKSQKKTFSTEWKERGNHYSMKVTCRYDDECGNGHNTFSITADIRENYKEYMGGCCHEEIAKRMPELAHLIKWHLVSSDEPMHYLANTVYHASNRDYNGLLKGERKQIRNGRTGKLCWILEADKDLEKYIDSDEQPSETAILRYVPLCNEGEGKEREFEHARSSAVWPEATDEQLSLSPEELKALLIARLPALMEEFKKIMESLGFIY